MNARNQKHFLSHLVPGLAAVRGRLEGKNRREKVGELKDYMQEVVALVHQYVPPDPTKIQLPRRRARPPPSGALREVDSTDL